MMPTKVIRYCNAASSGGDGTTNATSGSTAAYASLDAALNTEFGVRGNLVTADQQLTIKLEGTTAFGQVTQQTNAWTTDSTHYVEILCESPWHHAGVWSTSLPRFSAAVGTGTLRITTITNLRLKGLQVENTAGSGITGAAGIIVSTAASGLDIRIEECLIRATGTPTSFSGAIVAAAGNGGTYTFANNLIYGFKLAASGSGISCGSNGPSHVAYANSIINCRTGISRTNAAGTGTAKGNLFSGCTADAVSGGNWDSADYCATDQASFGTGAPVGTGNRVSQTFTFANSGSNDYTLASSDAGAKGFGTDLSADATFAVSTDVTGATRTGTWDIGASQVTTSGGGGGGSASSYYYRRRLGRH